jgi:glycosyltransferase involved in cell wall biosynthesis
MANKEDRMAKVCVVTSTFSESVGQTLLSRFIKVLEPLCERVFVITGAFEYQGRNKRVEVIRLKSHDDKRTTLKILRFIFSQFKMCQNLVKVHKNINIVFFYINATGLVFPIIFSKILGKKTALVISASDSKMAGMIYQNYLLGIGGKIFFVVYKCMERISYHFADRIVIDSERLIEDSGLGRYRYKVIAAGDRRFIESEIFRVKKPLTERGNLIGYIGRLSYEKGVMNLVKAIPLAIKQQSDLEFLIGGDGPSLSKLRSVIMGMGLDNKVKFTNWIPHTELVDYLNELKLLVLPSTTEGLPNTVLEAMACGTPVLVTPVGALPEIIKDKETGFIMKDNSLDSIAKGIIEALNYPHLEEVADNARTLVENRFTFQSAMERYKEILRSLDKW